MVCGRRAALVVAACLAGTAAVAGAQTPLTPLDPLFVTTLRSLNADVPTTVQFVNATARPVNVLWIDYTGAEVFYALLNPEQGYVQPTYVTHPWITRYADTRAAVVGFLPAGTPGLATIQPYVAAVPEPATVALVGAGVGVLVLARVRRRAARTS